MNKKKLIAQIDKLKNNQVQKYSTCIRDLINKYPDYYKDKDYAQMFIKNN